jgi:hypothetical protein
MAVIKKTDLDALVGPAREAKIAELEKAMLEMRGEGRADRVKPLKKAIAKLRTPRQKPAKKGPKA